MNPEKLARIRYSLERAIEEIRWSKTVEGDGYKDDAVDEAIDFIREALYECENED